MTDRTEYKKNQIARYIASAQSGLEKGFDCETARKDAMSGLGRAYDYMREEHGDAMRVDRAPLMNAWYDNGKQADLEALQAFDKKYDMPFSLAHVREKHFASFEKYGNIEQLKLILDLREQCKTAALIEKETKKSAAKKALIKSTAFPIISQATAPMKAAAVEETIRLADAYVADRKAFLAVAGFDPNVAVPHIQRTETWSAKFKNATSEEKQQYVRDNFNADLADQDRQPLWQFVERRDNGTFAWNQKGAKAYVAQQVRNTEAYYDSFVAKMVTKIPSATKAEYSQPHGAVWSHSILKVTKSDGSVEAWETKIIINRSKYDLLFNQWRTRLM